MRCFHTLLLALNMQHTYEHRYASLDQPNIVREEERVY